MFPKGSDFCGGPKKCPSMIQIPTILQSAQHKHLYLSPNMPSHSIYSYINSRGWRGDITRLSRNINYAHSHVFRLLNSYKQLNSPIHKGTNGTKSQSSWYLANKVNMTYDSVQVINYSSTYIQVFQRSGSVYMYTVHSCMYSVCLLWKSSVWPGQRSCAWPIFEPDVTLDLKCICVKFHHSTSNRSWVLVKTDRQTDGHTIKDDRIKHSWGILNKPSCLPFYLTLLAFREHFRH